jgi:hypothetical protein
MASDDPQELTERYAAIWNARRNPAPPAGNEILGVGLEVVVLAADGRVQRDYQFIES